MCFWICLVLLPLMGLVAPPSAEAGSSLDSQLGRLTAEAWYESGLGLDRLEEMYFQPSAKNSERKSKCESDAYACACAMQGALLAVDSRWLLRTREEPVAEGETLVFDAPSFSVVEAARVFPSHRSRAEQLKIATENSEAHRRRFKSLQLTRADFTALSGFLEARLGREFLLAAAMVDGFVNGFASAHDPFAYLTPMSIEGRLRSLPAPPEFSIGATFSARPEGWFIATVRRDGPAARAGLRQNDEILSIQGHAVSEIPLGTFIERLRAGPTEWRVRRAGEVLSLRFEGEMRAEPKFEAWLEPWRENGFAVLRLQTFEADNHLCREIGERIERLKEQKRLAGLVLDLRGNGGGSIQFAACVATLVLGPGRLIATLEDLKKSGRKKLFTKSAQEMKALGLKADLTTPLAVLIDGSSASAAELVAGALRDHHRAWLIGQTSWGKGTILDRFAWPETQPIAYEWKTTGRFYQPNGTSNQMVGILPDFIVPSRLGASPDEDLVSRNADENPEAPFKVNEASPPPRPEGIARVKACMDLDGLATEAKRLQTTSVGADYQLLFALEALRCTN